MLETKESIESKEANMDWKAKGVSEIKKAIKGPEDNSKEEYEILDASYKDVETINHELNEINKFMKGWDKNVEDYQKKMQENVGLLGGSFQEFVNNLFAKGEIKSGYDQIKTASEKFFQKEKSKDRTYILNKPASRLGIRLASVEHTYTTLKSSFPNIFEKK